MRTIVGIDPGLTGAIAVLSNGHRPAEVFDVPLVWTTKRKRATRGKRKGEMVEVHVSHYDLPAMSDLLDKIQGAAFPNEVLVGIEAQNVRPARGIQAAQETRERAGQGVVSAGKIMYGYGIWVGLCHGKSLVPMLAWPHVWKKAYPELKAAGKGAARLLAKRHWPHLVDSLDRVKDDGRADALLIAQWVEHHAAP